MRLLSIILFCLTLKLYAADTVRINDPANLLMTGTIGNINFTLGSDAPSGDATAESAPAKVYLPIQSGVVAPFSQLDYSTLKVNYGVTSLYNITSVTHFVSFPLLISVGSTAKYLYVAVRGGASGTSYYVSGRSASTYSNLSNSLVGFNIRPLDICKSVILNNISDICDVGGDLDPASLDNVIFKPMLYFFLSDRAIATDGSEVIVPATETGGVYFESQMSNRIYNPTALIVHLNSLKKGDGRVIGTFSSSTPMDSTLFKKVIVYQYTETATPIILNKPVGAADAGAIVNRDVSNLQSGEFTLNGLTNGIDYKFSIAFMDKFLFATALSTSEMETPTEIQELLKKQACFLLTVGFGEEHYVIDFFRNYRDQVMAHSWIGKKFIKLYYRSAPHYAMIIYQHEWMRSIIRAAAYVLYFLFSYYWLVLIFLGSCLFLDLSKNKISDIE